MGRRGILSPKLETITRQGEIRYRRPGEFEIAYRHVNGLNDEWFFVQQRVRLTPGDKLASLACIKTLLDHRAATQPTSEYNCGRSFAIRLMITRPDSLSRAV